ncbi:MAG: hypothetical protein HOP10_05985 [Chitinophagaceae bacterium]|nr:hypothetical protein [Chitinophagaceae bacterium]
MKQCLVLILAAFLFFVSSCSRIYHKSELHLQEQSFNRHLITFRTDGYYYTEIEEKRKDYSIPQDQPGHEYTGIGILRTVFYDDGYVNYGESLLRQNKQSGSLKQKIVDSLLTEWEKLRYPGWGYTNKKNAKVHIWDWGLYRQKGPVIELQYYSNHFGHYRLVTVAMSVLNDSTLLATHKYSPYVGMMPHIVDDSIDLIYKFRKYSPKPDSTNYLRYNIHKFGPKKK